MLRKILKWTGISIVLLLLIITGLVAMRQDVTFDAPYPQIKASSDSAVIARGKYLVYGPAHCADCHGPRGSEERVNAGEEVPLSGGNYFDIPPGRIRMPNITPDKTGIGNMSDETIARALRYGVSSEGRALFDFMPFHDMSDDDLTAVISYLRTTSPVKNEVPPSEFSVLGKVLRAFVLKPVGPSGPVPKSVQPDSSIEYGKYLATSVANCRGCHTDRDLKTGAFIGEYYAGGFKLESFVDPKYIFCSPNISPDKKTGHIASWDEQIFIGRFGKGKVYSQSPMPWGPFSKMNDVELKAIYRYLQTVAPVENRIDKVVEIKN